MDNVGSNLESSRLMKTEWKKNMSGYTNKHSIQKKLKLLQEMN